MADFFPTCTLVIRLFLFRTVLLHIFRRTVPFKRSVRLCALGSVIVSQLISSPGALAFPACISQPSPCLSYSKCFGLTLKYAQEMWLTPADGIQMRARGGCLKAKMCSVSRVSISGFSFICYFSSVLWHIQLNVQDCCLYAMIDEVEFECLFFMLEEILSVFNHNCLKVPLLRSDLHRLGLIDISIYCGPFTLLIFSLLQGVL